MKYRGSLKVVSVLLDCKLLKKCRRFYSKLHSGRKNISVCFVSVYKLPPLLLLSFPSYTCRSTLLWRAVNSPKSPFVGTSVCLPWCYGCPEQPRQTMSSSGVSPQMTPPSLRCVKSPEVWHLILISPTVVMLKLSRLFKTITENLFNEG